MRKMFATVMAGLALTACATVKESYAPDGRSAYAINCSGAARGWDKCMAAAGEQCGSAGYDVIDRNSEAAGAISATNKSLVGIRTNERTMLVACKTVAK